MHRRALVGINLPGSIINSSLDFIDYPQELTGTILTDQEFNTLRDRLKAFAQERDWEQFHSPKNLAMALIVEAAELLEHFQWLTPEQSELLAEDKRREVELEMADIFIYLMRMCERLDLDLLKVVEDKIKMNAEKYPADKVRGSAKKYSDY